MKRSAFSLIMLASAFAVQAQDPIIQTNYTRLIHRRLF